jgi:hypothetical protein
MTQEVLLIVHPGSACGSADMNLGRDNAAIQRLDMQSLVEGWQGPVLVIDGELSEELEGGRDAWSQWGQAIKDALSRASSAGLPSRRIAGDDFSEFNQEAAARALVQEFGFTPDTTEFALSGAWYESDTGGGCVGSVHDVLASLGFTASTMGAMDLDESPSEDEDCDDVDDLEETASPPSTGPRF